MTAVVFLGPSLPLAEAKERLDATYLPPAAQGDVWRATIALRPTVIGLVDGVFRHTPSVWHKEILFALSRGIHVLGAASMGALRAAELAPFGMRGIGTVFEAYRDGRLAPGGNAAFENDARLTPGGGAAFENDARLAPGGDAPFEDDDEVAVLHAPAEAGWQPLSEAMVDIRCTLAAAEGAGVIDAAERRAIAGIAKATFFAERAWPAILDRAAASGLAPARRAALAAWLGHGRVMQKRDDARLLLDEVRHLLTGPAAPFRAGFSFAHTTMWAMAVAEAGKARLDPTRTALEGPLAVLDELRLDPPAWRTALRAALLDELVADRSPETDPDDVRAALADLRQGLSLADRPAVEAWSALNEAPAGHLHQLAAAEAALRSLERQRAPHLLERMLDRLRAEGRYAGLRRRAAAKAAHRRRTGVVDTDIAAPDDVQVLRWYFEQRLGMDVPEDLEAFARDLGFTDADGLHRALQLECRFVLAGGGADGSDAPP